MLFRSRESIIGGEITKEEFISIFSEDRTLLSGLGVATEELPILLDYLLFAIG